jgi:hypothetical protein
MDLELDGKRALLTGSATGAALRVDGGVAGDSVSRA